MTYEEYKEDYQEILENKRLYRELAATMPDGYYGGDIYLSDGLWIRKDGTMYDERPEG